MDQIPTFLQVAVFVILGAAGVAYLLSIIRKDSHQETKELAETRGDRIGDLEQEVVRLGRKVDHLEGALEAYQRIKADEIAVEVARLLEPRLPKRTDPTPA
jgi:hypothetical protein